MTRYFRLPLAALSVVYCVACASETPIEPPVAVKAILVRIIAQVDFTIEIRLANLADTPVWVARCHSVERLVGGSWVVDPHLSEPCQSTPPMRLEADSTATRFILVRRAGLTVSDFADRRFRAVFGVGRHDGYAEVSAHSVATAAFRLQ